MNASSCLPSRWRPGKVPDNAAQIFWILSVLQFAVNMRPVRMDLRAHQGSIITGRRGIREGLESGSQRGSIRVVQVIEDPQRAARLRALAKRCPGSPRAG